MNKKTFWIIVGIAIAVLVILLIWQTAKINDIVSTGNVVRTAGQVASSPSRMVSGC